MSSDQLQQPFLQYPNSANLVGVAAGEGSENGPSSKRYRKMGRCANSDWSHVVMKDSKTVSCRYCGKDIGTAWHQRLTRVQQHLKKCTEFDYDDAKLNETSSSLSESAWASDSFLHPERPLAEASTASSTHTFASSSPAAAASSSSAELLSSAELTSSCDANMRTTHVFDNLTFLSTPPNTTYCLRLTESVDNGRMSSVLLFECKESKQQWSTVLDESSLHGPEGLPYSVVQGILKKALERAFRGSRSNVVTNKEPVVDAKYQSSNCTIAMNLKFSISGLWNSVFSFVLTPVEWDRVDRLEAEVRELRKTLELVVGKLHQAEATIASLNEKRKEEQEENDDGSVLPLPTDSVK